MGMQVPWRPETSGHLELEFQEEVLACSVSL